MQMNQEKVNQHGVAFSIEVASRQLQSQPEIKKRLEAESAAFGPQITLE
jgi:hypothetical protein